MTPALYRGVKLAGPLTGVACSILLAACASKPPQSAAASPAPAVVPSWDDPRLRSTLLMLQGPATSDTLTANEVFAAALVFNPDVDVARAEVAVARADVQRARQRTNPVLTFAPEHLVSAAAAGISPWVVAVSLVWPLRMPGKRALAIEQALATSDAALLTAANTVWTLRSASRAALCSAELAMAQTALAREEATLRTDLAARLRKQADAGLASEYDAARARLDRDLAIQRLRQSDSQAIAARHDLAAATGMPVAEIQRRPLGTSCFAPPPALAERLALQETAIAARLDLRAKLAEFRAADAAWRAEVKNRVPDLSVGPGYVYDQGDRRITFSLSAELPLFARNNAAIARAQADRRRVAAQVESLQRTVIGGIARARDEFELAQQQASAARELEAESDQLLARDSERFKVGELDRPAQIVSRIAVTSARTDTLTTASALIDATAALEAATQTPLVAPLFDARAAVDAVSAPDNGEVK
ncbi:MAG: TolC family protein [Pseudomonadota bacterium]